MGNEAWVLSYREECFDQIGLKPSIKIPVYNGSLECEFRKYAIFDGKMRDFRSEGGVVKTEEEKREMAQKHRFRKEREFKRRLDEHEENEEGDIRSFKFHSFDDKQRPARRGKDDRFGDRQDRPLLFFGLHHTWRQGRQQGWQAQSLQDIRRRDRRLIIRTVVRVLPSLCTATGEASGLSVYYIYNKVEIMNIKTSFIAMAAMLSMGVQAQTAQQVGMVKEQAGDKGLTLEDINFGGRNFHNMRVQNRLEVKGVYRVSFADDHDALVGIGELRVVERVYLAALGGTSPLVYLIDGKETAILAALLVSGQ